MKFKELKENIDKISKKIFDIKTEVKDRKEGEGFVLDVWIEILNDICHDGRSFWGVIRSNESLTSIQRGLSSMINMGCINYNKNEEVFIRIDIMEAYRIDKLD